MALSNTLDIRKAELARNGPKGSLTRAALPRFYPQDQIPPTPSIPVELGGVKVLVIGPPGSGKSHFIRWLMLSKSDTIAQAVVFSGTESSTGFYRQFVPDTFVYSNLNETDLERVFNERKTSVPYFKNTDVNNWLTLVIDDCATELKGASQKKGIGPVLSNIIKNGRHHRMFFVVGVQDVLDVPSFVRDQFDIFVSFKINSSERRKKFHDSFGLSAIFNGYQEFSALLNAVTNVPYTAMVIKPREGNGGIYWARAPPAVPNTIVGCAELLVFNKIVFDKASAERNGEIPFDNK